MKETVVVKFLNQEAFAYNKMYFAFLGRVVYSSCDDNELTMTFETSPNYDKKELMGILLDELAFREADDWEFSEKLPIDTDMLNFFELRNNLYRVGWHCAYSTVSPNYYLKLMLQLSDKQPAYAQTFDNNMVGGYLDVKQGEEVIIPFESISHSLNAYPLDALLKCERIVIQEKSLLGKYDLAYIIDKCPKLVKVLYSEELYEDSVKDIMFSNSLLANKNTVGRILKKVEGDLVIRSGFPTPSKGYRFLLQRTHGVGLRLHIKHYCEGGLTDSCRPINLSEAKKMLAYRVVMPTELVVIFENAVHALSNDVETNVENLNN